MSVTVSGKNYNQIDDCDAATYWAISGSGLTTDADTKKEGNNSLCAIFRAAYPTYNTAECTPGGYIDLSGVKHLRMWFLTTVGGLLETYANEGVQFYVTDGTNTCYWTVLGRDTYPGGFVNLVIDVSSTPDSGTKPSDMSLCTKAGFRMRLTGTAKNAVNTWWDNLCVCDGLLAYGDDAGGYFDLDDIWAADDAFTLGIGILRKIGGIYFSIGSLEMGDGSGTAGCKFNAKSQVLVFENRRVNSALYGITEVDNGTGTTEFITGSSTGTGDSKRGIEGCLFRVESLTQTPKPTFTATDTDISDLMLYGTTFLGFSYLNMPPTGTNKEALNCNFERCAELDPDTMKFRFCNWISSQSTTEGAVKIDTTSFDVRSSYFIGCSRAVRFPSGSQNTYNFYDLVFSNNTYDIRNEVTSGNTVTINKVGTSDPITHEEPNGGTTSILGSYPLYVICKNEAGYATSGIRVRIEDASTGVLISNGTTDSNGEYEDTYTSTVPRNVKVIVRLKGYKPANTLTAITADGLSVPFTMIRDPAVDLP